MELFRSLIISSTLLLPLMILSSAGCVEEICSHEAADHRKLNDPIWSPDRASKDDNHDDDFNGVPVRKLPGFRELATRNGAGSIFHKPHSRDHFEVHSPDIICPGSMVSHEKHCLVTSTPFDKFHKRFSEHPVHPNDVAQDYLMHGGLEVNHLRTLRHHLRHEHLTSPHVRRKRSPEEFVRNTDKHVSFSRGAELCFGDVCEKSSEPQKTGNQQKTGADPRIRHILLLGTLSNETLELFSSCADYREHNVSTMQEIQEIFARDYDETKYHLVNVPSPSTHISAELIAAKLKIIIDEMYKKFSGFSYASIQPGNHTSSRREERKSSEIQVWSELIDYCQTNYYWGCKVVQSVSDTVHAIASDNEFTIQLEKYSAKKPTQEKHIKSGSQKAFEGQEHPLVRWQVHKLAQEYCKVAGHTFALVTGTMAPEFRSLGRIVTFNSNTRLTLADIFPTDKSIYDKNLPPKQRGRPTVVNFHVTVLSMDSINEESMTYVTDIFLAQSWRDHRLRLPEDMERDYRILDVQWLQNIWRPDVFFKNAKKVTFHEISIPNHYLWLFSDKTLLYMSRLTLVLSCAMEFQSFPHDTQICSMMLESLSHTTLDLVFKWNITDPLVVNPSIALPQLDIARNSTEDCTLQYSTGNFTCVAVVFNLKRRIGYHMFHTFIPSALIVVMSWISFWIKPEAIPARVTLGVTSLLTLVATQNTQSQSSLPPVSYVKAVDIWMSSCAVFVFASLMEFAIVNYFMDLNPMGPAHISAIPPADEEELAALTMKYSLVDSAIFLPDIEATSRMFSFRPQYITTFTGKEIAVLVDKISRVIFPVAFITLNIIYWTTFIV